MAGRLSPGSLAVAAGLWASIAVPLGFVILVLRRRFREMRIHLRDVALGQEAIQRDLDRVIGALGEVGGVLRRRADSLRERRVALRPSDPEVPSDHEGSWIPDHEGSWMLVLRRGALDPRRTAWAGQQGPSVARAVVDRRVAERRRGQWAITFERRVKERRQPPAATWSTAGFVLVPLQEPTAPREAAGSSRTG